MIWKKKGLQVSHADFSVSFRWAPLELMGPLKPTAFLKPMGPGVIEPPCPPSRWPCVSIYIQGQCKYFYHSISLYNRVHSTVLHSISQKYALRLTNFFRGYSSWSSGNTFVSRAGGLRFKSRAGQIGHSVANGLLPQRQFFERSWVARRNDAEIGPANSLHASAYYTEYNEAFYFIIYFLSPLFSS